MRFSSRFIRHANRSVRGHSLLLALGALALGLVGCEDRHIGRPCLTNASDAGTSGDHVAIISSPDLACPERLCLQPAIGTNVPNAAAVAAEGSFCTAACASDSDCSDADPSSRCTSGFVCAVATTSGPFCCQKLCVCHDFVLEPAGGFPTPTACLPSNGGGPATAICPNVQ